jgi:hypothetical protein
MNGSAYMKYDVLHVMLCMYDDVGSCAQVLRREEEERQRAQEKVTREGQAANSSAAGRYARISSSSSSCVPPCHCHIIRYQSNAYWAFCGLCERR